MGEKPTQAARKDNRPLHRAGNRNLYALSGVTLEVAARTRPLARARLPPSLIRFNQISGETESCRETPPET